MPGNIVLIGFMGAGKSTVARALSVRLGFSLHDTDALIERSAKRSIADIFATDGEDVFRELEERAVARATSGRGRVIACGGGAVLRDANVQALRDAGAVVYLRAPLAVVRQRLRGSDHRPLVRGRGALERLYAERDPLYERVADITIDATGSPVEVAERIVEALV